MMPNREADGAKMGLELLHGAPPWQSATLGARSRPGSRSGIRVLESRNGASVVELRVPRRMNPIWGAFRALAEIGVRLVHTEVRVHDDELLQELHLLEPDESCLTPSRLRAALRALARSHRGLAEGRL